MKASFQKIFNDYEVMYNSPYKPSIYELAKFIESDFPLEIMNNLEINTSMYLSEGSVGQGNWTDTPWISLFDKEITETAQKGFYIVYLFRKDMQGVYLSLNQGTKYIKTKYKGQKPKDKMRIIASNIRKAIIYNTNLFPLEEIDLVTNTDNARGYMAAHICGKFYSANSLPAKEELINDLQELTKIYSQLKGLMTGKTTEETLDYFLQKEEIEDIQFQNDVLVAPPANTNREPQPVPHHTTINGKQSWKRNPSIAKESLKEAAYKCISNEEHLSFISQVTNENFVEAHHLIPMKLQGEFFWSLDVPGNIVSLCPNCHRKIHHANRKERKVLIKSLFNKKDKDLPQFGLSITLEKLLKSYGC